MKSFMLYAVSFLTILTGLKGCSDSRAPEKGTDPKDYYGTYYFLDDYTSYKFEIESSGECNLLIEDGRNTTREYHIFDFEYVSNEYANYLLSTSNSHNGYDAIMVYSGGYQELSLESMDSAIVLWAQKNGNAYTLQINSTGAVSRTNEPSVFEITGSSNVVYGSKYAYNSSNYLLFSTTGKVTWCSNGEKIEYSYLCVSKGWASKYYKSVSSSYSSFVLVYDSYEQHQYLFGISGNSIINGNNTYSK